MKLTAEQKKAVELAKKGESMKIEAFAGAGKTTTLKAIGNALAPKKGVYLAFNKDIATEAEGKFPANVECRTAHAVAYKEVGYKYGNQGRIVLSINSLQVAEDLLIKDDLAGATPGQWGAAILGTIQRFCYSADREFSRKHIPFKMVKDLAQKRKDFEEKFFVNEVLELAAGYWEEQIDLDDTTPVLHDTYLKLWALNKPKIRKDFILFDEAQDANPVMLDIVMQQKSQKILVGDRYQQIYSWRGAVNAMDKIKTKHSCSITQSFRFGQSVANVANEVLYRHLGAAVDIKGFPKVRSFICHIDKPDCMIFRTNASLFGEALKRLDSGLKLKINGGVGELYAMIQSAENLMCGRKATHAELAPFDDWESVLEYVKLDEVGGNLKTMVALINKYGTGKLKKSLNKIKRTRKPDMVLTTTHKAKGCEWPKVKLGNDFRKPDQKGYVEEETNLLYVALTRAQNELDITECEAAQDALSYSANVTEKVAPPIHDIESTNNNNDSPEGVEPPEQNNVKQEPSVKRKKDPRGRKKVMPADYLQGNSLERKLIGKQIDKSGMDKDAFCLKAAQDSVWWTKIRARIRKAKERSGKQ